MEFIFVFLMVHIALKTALRIEKVGEKEGTEIWHYIEVFPVKIFQILMRISEAAKVGIN